MEVISATHPLPNEFFEGEDLSSFSYICVSHLPDKVKAHYKRAI